MEAFVAWITGVFMGLFGGLALVGALIGMPHRFTPKEAVSAAELCAPNGGLKEFDESRVWCANGATFKVERSE